VNLGAMEPGEREGFGAGMDPGMEEQVRTHRTIPPEQADLELHLAVEPPAIAAWRDRDGAELVASARPRDPAKGEPVAVFLVVHHRQGAA
jgi:hypothetical protein